MNYLKNKWTGRTYMKYALSYLIIVTVLVLGSFFIVRSQLTHNFTEQRNLQTQVQLDNLANYLTDNLASMAQINRSLNQNVEIILSRYDNQDYNNYVTWKELEQYDICSQFINGIAYLPPHSEKAISTNNYWIFWKDECFSLMDETKKTLTFDPTPYLDSDFMQLIHVSENKKNLLIYFPPTKSTTEYFLFYVLDQTVIQQQMKNLISDETPAVALLDENMQCVTGLNAELLEPHLRSLRHENGIQRPNASTSVCVLTGIGNGFSLVSLISNDSMSRQINSAFADSYLTLMLLGAFGFLLVFLAMRITYMPLHRLTQKILPGTDSSQNYVDQLDLAFSRAEEQNQALKSKLDHYRLSMQKSLLDSVVTSKQWDGSMIYPNIDQFFDTESNKEIFALRMASPSCLFPHARVRKYLSEVLPGTDSCIILESQADSAIFLINYIGTEQNKKEVIKELLNSFYEEEGFLSAISNGTDSPMDIPSLYENVCRASGSWPEIPVVDYESLPPATTAFAYPYEKLNQLSDALKENQFAEARQFVKELFETIDHSLMEEGNLPDFFVRSILIDILTVIINCVNQANLKFKSCSDLYFETLYFCRSCPYGEKRSCIASNTYKLIDCYEQEVFSKLVNPVQIRQMMEKFYCQPDFSISVLADEFQVSIAYMSYLIKKELNQNFSDYLWTLRLNKAKELLRSSDVSIDEISIAVGYFNTSSFRRKFKQETGLTPSQFRAGEQS